MTQRLFLLPPTAWGDAGVGDVVAVTGPEARHALQVVRLTVGERVLVADGTGRRGSGEVVGATRDELSVRLTEVEVVPEPSPRFVLVQALAKGDRDEQAVEAATELGVDVVVPWQSERSIVQWRGEKQARGRARWESVVTAAAKQSRRARVPLVEPLVRMPGLRARLEGAALALVLHEEATTALAGVGLPTDGDVVLVVGPEGGITPAELAALLEVGARSVRLGPEVLRSSGAGPAALAVLNALGRWR
ncbi:MAG: 16S rRNA (uracil(1498)-N(3))-methyltransferase [Actinomycetota bacterium]|nr:16S rRNA (uracil(1498)-N(3))-methyltransferase [Actinomycetota bacterium]